MAIIETMVAEDDKPKIFSLAQEQMQQNLLTWNDRQEGVIKFNPQSALRIIFF